MNDPSPSTSGLGTALGIQVQNDAALSPYHRSAFNSVPRLPTQCFPASIQPAFLQSVGKKLWATKWPTKCQTPDVVSFSSQFLQIQTRFDRISFNRIIQASQHGFSDPPRFSRLPHLPVFLRSIRTRSNREAYYAEESNRQRRSQLGSRSNVKRAGGGEEIVNPNPDSEFKRQNENNTT